MESPLLPPETVSSNQKHSHALHESSQTSRNQLVLSDHLERVKAESSPGPSVFQVLGAHLTAYNQPPTCGKCSPQETPRF